MCPLTFISSSLKVAFGSHQFGPTVPFLVGLQLLLWNDCIIIHVHTNGKVHGTALKHHWHIHTTRHAWSNWWCWGSRHSCSLFAEGRYSHSTLVLVLQFVHLRHSKTLLGSARRRGNSPTRNCSREIDGNTYTIDTQHQPTRTTVDRCVGYPVPYFLNGAIAGALDTRPASRISPRHCERRKTIF